MNRQNNSTELGGRKELSVNLSNDFDADCEFGFLGWGINNIGKIKTVGSIKLKGNFKDMKSAGKLRQQTKEMINDRKQAEATR